MGETRDADLRERHPDLEAQIARDPENPAGYLVYADWLIERGDPRGELINLQVELARDPSVERRERVALLLARHRAEWIGALDGENPGRVTWTWRNGFFRCVRLGAGYGGHAALYRVMRKLTSACFLHELAISDFRLTDTAWNELVSAIEDRPLPTTLRTLSIGFSSSAFDGDLEQLAVLNPQLGGLESLRIRGLDPSLSMLSLPALRSLEFDAFMPTVEAMLDIRWPHLESLVLHLHDVPLAIVESLLSGASFPALTTLALAADISVVAMLARSPVLARLQTLDLSQMNLGRQCVFDLLENHTAFARLAKLRIGRQFDRALVNRLTAAFGSIMKIG
jgi:uncharacterized protein (TIGR02996 family)